MASAGIAGGVTYNQMGVPLVPRVPLCPNIKEGENAMKVFISWSGPRSKAVAELLRDWIKCVIQATRPWISTRDIDRGALWFTEISDQLKDTTVGIVCLTQENKNKPWILFEAGALAKGISSSRVCTFLIDLKPSDIEDPLAQFNHTLPERESIWELIHTLNNCLSANGLDERILEQVFATYWDQFDRGFKDIIKKYPPSEKPEPRSEKNLLAEILDNTRFLNNKIRSIESKIEMDKEKDLQIPIFGGRTLMEMTPAEARAQGISVSLGAATNVSRRIRSSTTELVKPATEKE